jgi:heptosyltransferase II
VHRPETLLSCHRRMQFLVYQFYRLGFGLFCLLPIEFCFRVGWGLGWLAYWVAGSYRRLVLDNLRCAFGEPADPLEHERLARRHFATLGANLVSSARLVGLSQEEILARIQMDGVEHARDTSGLGRGFVVVISHLGNWEIFSQVSTTLFGCATGTVYQRLGNRFIDRDVQRRRARLGLQTFERKEGVQAAMRMLRQGGAVGVLVDQHAGDAGMWVPFFGRLASTSPLAATMALRTGAALVPAAIYTTGVARWRVVVSPPIPADSRDIAQLTCTINAVVERQIRESPADWFWVHNRWKTPDPEFLFNGYRRGCHLPPGMTAAELQPFRVVIRSPNWLGDAVMSVPAVRAIRGGRPDIQVTVLTPAKLGAFWRRVEGVDAVIEIQPGEGVRAVARKLRGRFEAGIVFPNSIRVALELFLAGVPRRYGWCGRWRRRLLNQIPREKGERKPPPHHAHRYLGLALRAGAPPPAELVFPESAAPVHPDGRCRVGLVPGAEYGPAKRWLPERFAEVGRQLAESRGAHLVLLGTATDAPVAAEIAAQLGAECVNLTGQTSLGELMDELRQCDVVLTNDTGTMHLAAFLGRPVVAIFGSTEPLLTAPLAARARLMRHHVPCSPCFLRTCPLDFRCMKGVSTEEVRDAVLELLGEKAQA